MGGNGGGDGDATGGGDGDLFSGQMDVGQVVQPQMLHCTRIARA